MAVSPNPEDWTPQQRAACLANDLVELLKTAPTERSVWWDREGAQRQEEKAQEISGRMKAVYESGRE